MGLRLVVRSVSGQRPRDEVAYAFEQPRVVIGRSAGADVRLPHPTVSEIHAALLPDGAKYTIQDDGSTNGTFVNGERLVPHRRRGLRDGDEIEVGDYRLVYRGHQVVTQPTSGERTAELARRLFREGQRAIGQPRLVVLTGLQTGARLEIPAPPSRMRIGRTADCQLILDDPEVSSEHAELVRDLDGVLVRNLDSTNGTEVGGHRIDERRLKDGDELLVGKTRILFEEPADEPMRAVLAEQDRVMTRATPTPPEPQDDGDAAATTPDESRAAPPPRRASNDADLVIYTLALIVIMVSLAGLFVLLSAN